MFYPNPYISIVIPVYNEEKNLEELYRRLTGTLDALGKPYEIIFPLLQCFCIVRCNAG